MTERKITRTLGAVSEHSGNFQLNQDEFVQELRGKRGIHKYREMADSDPVIGATLMAIDMLIRVTKWHFEGEPWAVDFITEVFNDMECTLEEHTSEVLTFLPYGFSLFEIIGKKRKDGKIGLHNLSPRPQWTIDEFDVDRTGKILGVKQSSNVLEKNPAYIPADKFLLYRTTSRNNDPAGRSILRNAHKSYHYVSRIQEYEAIAIERELNGIPLGRIPAEYLDPEADSAKQAVLAQMKDILRDVKRNEQGYILLPSDLQETEDGKLSDKYLVDFNLVASSGTRDIDTNQVITRHQSDIARTVLADFLMLGSSGRGSYAMSKSKTEIFVHAVSGYLDSMSTPINKHLIPLLWKLNGFPEGTEPKIKPGSVMPVDLRDLGMFIRTMSQSGFQLEFDEELEDDLRTKAGLPVRPEGLERRPDPELNPGKNAGEVKEEDDDEEDDIDDDEEEEEGKEND